MRLILTKSVLFIYLSLSVGKIILRNFFICKIIPEILKSLKVKQNILRHERERGSKKCTFSISQSQPT